MAAGMGIIIHKRGGGRDRLGVDIGASPGGAQVAGAFAAWAEYLHTAGALGYGAPLALAAGVALLCALWFALTLRLACYGRPRTVK